MSLYFEEFEIGDSWETAGRTLTEADLVNFAGISGDHYWFHMDAEKAADGPFGERVAHGALIFSIMTGQAIRLGILDETLIAYSGTEKMEFLAPTMIGDTIHTIREVSDKERRDDEKGVVEFTDKVFNQDDELVLRCINHAIVKTESSGE